MRISELNLGKKLNKEEMKRIAGGETGSGSCTTCTDGEINYITTNDPGFVAALCATWLSNDQIDGYACSDGEGGGEMDGCPI